MVLMRLIYASILVLHDNSTISNLETMLFISRLPGVKCSGPEHVPK